MKFSTVNPATGEILREHEAFSREKAFSIAKEVKAAASAWAKLDVSGRSAHLRNLAAALRKRKEHFANLMTLEMGKPIRQSLAEVEKCAVTAEVYAENTAKWLGEELVQADGKRHSVTFGPLGTVLAVMPWNFPFWQAFRFGIPAMAAGNTVLLKHSNAVPECALAIEEVFREAGFPENSFRTIISDHETVSALIGSPYVDAVSVTGSTSAGSKVAEEAGRSLKKCVLELGGSDPFIVLDDADIDFAARNAVQGRTLNSGQSCIAAKRFIVEASVAEDFIAKFVGHMNALKVGDPMLMETDVGPLSSGQQLLQVESQLRDSVALGAKVLCGGKRLPGKGFFLEPAVVGNVSSGMRVVKEEVFGPVAPVIAVRDDEEAVMVANDSEFGLGASIWSSDEGRAMEMAGQIECGVVFINSIVKSDARMPFGGVKKSGIGRELSKYGLREFANIRAMNIYEPASGFKKELSE